MSNNFISHEIENKISKREDFLNVFNRSKIAVSFVNPFSYQILSSHISVVDDIDILFSDGALFCALSNLHRKNKIDRVSFDFSSIAGDVFNYAVHKKLNIALVGGTESEIELATDYLQNRYPGLKISYTRNGYFSKDEYSDVIDDIDNKSTDILICGMGTPLQEEFIVFAKNNSQSINFSFTCGGFLTQTSLKGDYYHPIIKRLGLRWLQRCVMHKHVRDRLLKDYPIFIISYLLNIKIR